MIEIPDFPGYYADEQGRIWSSLSGKLRKLKPYDDGYLKVHPILDGKARTCYVHRLVCRAFHGESPPNTQASHLDGNPKNNKPDNLCWETPKENNQRKHQHGTMGLNRKLDKLDKKEVEDLLLAGLSQMEIADLYDVSQSTISSIKLQSGMRPGKCKLSDLDLLEIRRMVGVEGLSQVKVASRFGLSESAIWRIKHRDYKPSR